MNYHFPLNHYTHEGKPVMVRATLDHDFYRNISMYTYGMFDTKKQQREYLEAIEAEDILVCAIALGYWCDIKQKMVWFESIGGLDVNAGSTAEQMQQLYAQAHYYFVDKAKEVCCV